MNIHRVVVTGLGAVSGTGLNVESNWHSLLAGISGVKRVSESDYPDEVETIPFPVTILGKPKNFLLEEELLSARESGRYDLFIHYALKAAQEALAHGELLDLNKSPYERSRMGVILGVGMGGFPFIEKQYRELLKKSRPKTNPFFITSVIPNMAPGLISMRFGLEGANFAVSSACASSGHAILNAFQLIQLGQQDVILAGGSEAVFTKLTTSGFATIKALSTRDVDPEQASCPFDRDRDGFVMGEGSGILLLENRESAIKRGAKILAEIVSVGLSSDAYHVTAPHPDGKGAINSMKQALEIAKIPPEEVDYINAHGTSTPIGDKIESQAIKTVFGKHAYELNISSTKSMTGHLLGAAAGLESVICVKSLLTQSIAPTINLKNPDPECDLNYTPNTMAKKSIKYAMNNSFGFGGTNTSILFKSADA